MGPIGILSLEHGNEFMGGIVDNSYVFVMGFIKKQSDTHA